MSEEGDIPERDAKHALYRDLDTYIHERIYQADGSIVTYAIEKITKDKDSVIMTYGRSSVVEQILLTAHDIGRTFSVVIVDSGPLFEGKRLLHSLSSKGIRCSYALVPALSAVLHNVNLVLLGAHSLYANGSLYSRAGTALVAMMASHRSIPVLACCETYKFSNGVPFDGFAKNELASHLLTDLQPNLQALNPLYDLTPATSVSAVITEYGLIPPSSVPTVLWRLGIQE
ncbi:nagb/rpia/CoA transferase-like protein [Clavulina sp. PMI_390]|nr:nagb/rpia/CoA transferase-like protein [Clavulina sp. PMI_390]